MDFESADIKEIKEWLFKERLQLEEDRKQLEEDRKAFEAEKRETLMRLEDRKTFARVQAKRLEMGEELIKQKLEVLHEEYTRLAREKARLDNERKTFEARKAAAGPPKVNKAVFANTGILFNGVDSELALKKRYRDLLKIFHPDNMNGSTEAIQSINMEYNSLKKMY
ncbi:MAG: hypothetical protein ACI4EN_00930 [Butyrivibrio sp.]